MTGVRSRRLRALAELLRSDTLASQEEATERLRSLGFAVTQGTVSRDLDQLGAIKVKRGGVLSYALPDQVAGADWSADRLERILGEWVLSIEAVGQMLVLKTPPGSAHLVASALDQARIAEVAGTVSGDDTLFVALRDGVVAHAVAKRLEKMMGRDEVRIA